MCGKYACILLDAAPVRQGTSAAGAVLTGIIAIALIYLVTVFLPKIAAAADKLLDRNVKKDVQAENDGDYKVYDIYQGELNIKDENKKE